MSNDQLPSQAFRIMAKGTVHAVCRWQDCRGCEPHRFPDLSEAERWLRGFVRDSTAMSGLRRIATACDDGVAAAIADDEDLCRRLACQFVTGHLRVCGVTMEKPRVLVTAGPPPAVEEAPRPVPRPKPAPRVAPEVEPSTFPESFDAVAAAAVLRQAAQNGTPFCEECEKAKAWLKIELLGEDGQPVPHEPYRVVLPDGRTMEGTLDSHGTALFEQLEAGECTVSFVDLDADAWGPT